MRICLFSFLTLPVLAMAADSTPREPTKAELAVIEEGVREALKDPASAQFRRIRFKPDPVMPLACGEVNAKNTFGGYTGFTTFFAMLGEGVNTKTGKKELFVGAVEIDGPDGPIAKLMCTNKGF